MSLNISGHDCINAELTRLPDMATSSPTVPPEAVAEALPSSTAASTASAPLASAASSVAEAATASSALNVRYPPWSPSTLVPSALSSHIFSYLDPTALRTACRVSRTWQQPARAAALSQEQREYQEFRRQQVIFGPEDWKICFGGDPGVVPPPHPSVYKLLKEPCPYWPEKTRAQTHQLLCIPETINGVPLTFNTLGELARASQGERSAIGYSHVWDQIITDHGKTPMGPARWLLVTKEVIPKSRGKSFADQVDCLSPGYRVAKLGEAAALAFTRRANAGEFLLGNDFTRCEERSDGYPVTVGCFAPRGLYVNYYGSYDVDGDGVVGVLPCGSSLAIGT